MIPSCIGSSHSLLLLGLGSEKFLDTDTVPASVLQVFLGRPPGSGIHSAYAPAVSSLVSSGLPSRMQSIPKPCGTALRLISPRFLCISAPRLAQCSHAIGCAWDARGRVVGQGPMGLEICPGVAPLPQMLRLQLVLLL